MSIFYSKTRANIFLKSNKKSMGFYRHFALPPAPQTRDSPLLFTPSLLSQQRNLIDFSCFLNIHVNFSLTNPSEM